MGLLGDFFAGLDNKKRVAASNLRGLLGDPAGHAGLLGRGIVEELAAMSRSNLLNADASMSVMPQVREQANMAALPTMLGMVGAIRAAGMPEPNKSVVDAASAAFGKTHNPLEAGYMIPDGTMLDLSGRHYATGYANVGGKYLPSPGKPDYLRAARNVDHRELPESVLDAIGSNGGTQGMRRFMEESNSLRLAPNIGFETTFVPTTDQLKSIANQWKYASEPIAIDVAHPKTGAILASTEMTRPTVEKMRKFIADVLKDYVP